MARKIIGKGKNQLDLFPPSLKDMLTANHIVFLFERVVKALDLSCIKNNYGNVGGAYHDPFNMFCVIFTVITRVLVLQIMF